MRRCGAEWGWERGDGHGSGVMGQGWGWERDEMPGAGPRVFPGTVTVGRGCSCCPLPCYSPGALADQSAQFGRPCPAGKEAGGGKSSPWGSPPAAHVPHEGTERAQACGTGRESGHGAGPSLWGGGKGHGGHVGDMWETHGRHVGDTWGTQRGHGGVKTHSPSCLSPPPVPWDPGSLQSPKEREVEDEK